MLKKQSLTSVGFLTSAVILLVLASSLGYFWISAEYQRLSQASSNFRTRYMEWQKNLIRNEVDRAIDFIRFQESMTERRVRNNVRERVYEAHAAATHLYTLYHGKMPDPELKRIIIETLRPMRYNEGRGYYFATSITGIEELFADRPELEQKDLLDMRDTNGKYVIRDMIEIARNKSEGFYEYTWTKPGKQGTGFPKVAFIKYFQPYGFFIGTGEYLDDVEGDIKKETLERISRITFGNDGYITVLSADGKILSHPRKELLGRSTNDLNEPQISRIMEDIRQIASRPGGGYYAYIGLKPGNGKRMSKLSYVNSFPEWGWLVITGVYLDDIEKAVRERNRLDRQTIRGHILFISALFLSFLIISLSLTWAFSRKTRGGIAAFMTFFRRAAFSHEKIEPEKLPFTEFVTLGEYTNKMVDDFRSARDELRSEKDRARMYLDTAPVMFVALDTRCRVTLVNRKGCEIMGYESNEILNRDWVGGFIAPQDRDCAQGIYRSLLAGSLKGNDSFVCSIISKNGTEHIMAWHNSLLRSENGEITGILISGEDITERRKAEETLKESEEKFSRIFRLSPEMIAISRISDGIYLDVNDAFERETGFSREDVIGRSSVDLGIWKSLDDRQRVVQSFTEQGGRVSRQEVTLVRKDGTAFIAMFSAVIIDIGREKLLLTLVTDITDRKESEAMLNHHRIMLEHAQAVARIGYWQFDMKDGSVWASTEAKRIYGLENSQWTIPEVQKIPLPEYRKHLDDALHGLIHDGSGYDIEFKIRRPTDGAVIDIHSIAEYDAREQKVFGVIQDITDRKHAENERNMLKEQLLQAQKMESVGRLAGGVAHDFNNMLTPIMGYAEILQDELKEDDPNMAFVEQIISSAERSRNLVRQLLAFARKQTLEMKPVSLNKVIEGFRNMLRRTLHENVQLEISLSGNPDVIRADVGQLEQILLNLSVNAQDAMPDGGTLSIETGEAVLDEDYARTHEGVSPGLYVVMTVKDTGTGMAQETFSHIFEPFFTTKGTGKGTGLGLATVYGIVKQHGGHIVAESRAGEGTLFRVYFPLHEGSAADKSQPVEKGESLRGSETILVVEDESQVRNLAVRVLRQYGYQVIEASDGRTAQQVANSFAGDIHMLLTDVILPDMNGRAIFESLSASRNGLKVLYMSGYTSDVIGHHGILEEGVHFIQKPFRHQDLAHKVRDAIGGGSAGVQPVDK